MRVLRSLISKPKILQTALVALPVAACGGGGGGGGGGTPSVGLYTTPSANFTPFIGSFTAEGLSSTASISLDNNGNTTSATITPSSTRRVYTFTTIPNPNAATQDPQIITSESPNVPSPGQMTGEILGNGTGQYQGYADGNTSSVQLSNKLSSSLGTTSLSYSFVGGTSMLTSPNLQNLTYTGSTYFGGQKTKPSDMPTSGTATYTGAYNGRFINAQTGVPLSTSNTDGTVTMNADFSAATVNGRVSNYRNVTYDNSGNVASSTPISADITFSGNISGTNIAGTAGVVTPNTNTPLQGYTQSGSLQGSFFGPQAAEAAGTLSVKATNNVSSTIAQGVFGAKKN